MKIILILILFAALGATGYWLLNRSPKRSEVQKARDEIVAGAERLKEAAKEAFADLNTDNISKELERTGKVVRSKAREAGEVLSDLAGDAKITAQIKAGLIADSKLSALSISVNTTDGVVTLAGTVESNESIARAMQLALDVKGVRQVISTLQVKPRK